MLARAGHELVAALELRAGAGKLFPGARMFVDRDRQRFVMRSQFLKMSFLSPTQMSRPAPPSMMSPGVRS